MKGQWMFLNIPTSGRPQCGDATAIPRIYSALIQFKMHCRGFVYSSHRSLDCTHLPGSHRRDLPCLWSLQHHPPRDFMRAIWRSSTFLTYKPSLARNKTSGLLSLWLCPICSIWTCRILLTTYSLVIRLGTSNFRPMTFYSTNTWEEQMCPHLSQVLLWTFFRTHRPLVFVCWWVVCSVRHVFV
jgi:hypothetical protein